VRSILGQQLSVHAARAIHDRLVERLGGDVAPHAVLAAPPDDLRAVGLSWAKVASLRSLAEHVLDGSLALEALDAMGDDEVVDALVVVKGIGPWSAQVFAMFQLGRPDVLPVGDLGVRRAAERFYALDGLPDAATLTAIAEPWRPHRTMACRVLWQALHATPA
jgi:DNA-3-methyladenine glycosylase II